MTLGDGCYTWQEAATDAALGATGAGLGARWAWRYGPRSLTRVTGKEWSHAISRKMVEKYADLARDYAKRHANSYPKVSAAAKRAIDRMEKAMNKRGGINGSWASPRRHYRHDPRRFPRGWREMGERLRPTLQSLDRIPDWIKLSIGGGIRGAAGGNIAMDAIP